MASTASAAHRGVRRDLARRAEHAGLPASRRTTTSRAPVPYVSEPWYCCAEPMECDGAMVRRCGYEVRVRSAKSAEWLEGVSGNGDDKRVLLVATTLGYQIRSFGEAAAELGVRLVFASDRCDRLEDPVVGCRDPCPVS